jgi:transposase-like protein
MDKNCIVYCIRNKRNNKIYIGSTRRTAGIRWSQHVGLLSARKHSKQFQEDWDKYSIQDWQLTIVEENIEYRLLGLVESYWIKHFNAGDAKYGYNTVKQYVSEWVSRRNTKLLGVIDGVITDLKGGLTYRNIAEKYGMSHGTVWSIKQKYLSDMPVSHSRLSREEKNEIVKMLESGEKVCRVADKFNVSDATIHATKKKLLPGMVRLRISDEKKSRILELRQQGLNYRKIAEEVKVSLGSIGSVINQHAC